MNIVFRADSSTEIGFGHVTRCLSLANQLQSNRCTIQFICKDYSGNLINKIKSSGFMVSVLPDNERRKDNISEQWSDSICEKDAVGTVHQLFTDDINWLVVDHYKTDFRWHSYLRQHVKKILVIDDMANKKIDCDALLNPTLSITKRFYDKKLSRLCKKKFFGSQYALLKPEFSQLRKKKRSTKTNLSSVKNILISFGGTDTKNITAKVITELNRHYSFLRDIIISVTTNDLMPHKDEINRLVEESLLTITIYKNQDSLAEIIANTDIAIGAAGTTSWERCCLGVPTIIIETAANQRIIADKLIESGAAKKIDIDNLQKDLFRTLQELINDPSELNKMSNNAFTICDGRGVKKVASYMMEN